MVPDGGEVPAGREVPAGGVVPDGRVANGVAADGRVANGVAADGRVANGDAADGRVSIDGRVADDTVSVDSNVAADGKVASGQVAVVAASVAAGCGVDPNGGAAGDDDVVGSTSMFVSCTFNTNGKPSIVDKRSLTSDSIRARCTTVSDTTSVAADTTSVAAAVKLTLLGFVWSLGVACCAASSCFDAVTSSV